MKFNSPQKECNTNESNQESPRKSIARPRVWIDTSNRARDNHIKVTSAYLKKDVKQLRIQLEELRNQHEYNAHVFNTLLSKTGQEIMAAVEAALQGNIFLSFLSTNSVARPDPHNYVILPNVIKKTGIRGVIIKISKAVFKFNKHFTRVITMVYSFLRVYHIILALAGQSQSFFFLKLKLCLGNSSVVKIYIIRPIPGQVAKNATPRPSGWESNPRPLDY